MSKKFHVTYFYSASGMEGAVDQRDYGVVSAADEDDAREQIALRMHPTDTFYGPDNSYSTRAFFKGCLKAVEID